MDGPRTGRHLEGKTRTTVDTDGRLPGGGPRERDRVDPNYPNERPQRACPSDHHLRQAKEMVERGHARQEKGARPSQQKEEKRCG